MVYVVSDELYHHGVKGQKWGVRNYQNADGSLTAAGRLHYYGTSAASAAKKYGKVALGKASQIRENSYAKRDRQRIVGRPKSRSEQSLNPILDKMGGRKIGASYETRVNRGRELKAKHRTQLGAIGRHIGRGILFGLGTSLAVGALANGSAIANYADKEKLADILDVGHNTAKSILAVAAPIYTATSVVRTYQDIADIHTYKKDKRKNKNKSNRYAINNHSIYIQ